MRILWSVLLMVMMTFAARPAFADDLADEAELQFQLGADRYKAGDFRGALEHFLASNRLVPNRNVVFNIARAYENLHEMPNAHRYYTTALDQESNPAAKKKIAEALQRISSQVAVIKIETNPPNATVYIDRKDLGPRGESPRALGLAAGSYRIVVAKEGYEDASAGPLKVRAGTTTPVLLSLRAIVSSVRIQGEAGAVAHIDREDAALACTLPCTLQIPPGRHTIYAQKVGFQSLESAVDVVRDRPQTVSLHMIPVTGNLVVSADVRDALVSVDGKATGFTPVVLTAPVGVHRVQISQEGFRSFEQTVVVGKNQQTRVDAQLLQVEEVNAASRSTESVDDAPSSVSIISREEIRAMAYPTIAEAIRGVRGVYLSQDYAYENAGFRGFSRPGDYGNRVLVLIDGQPTNDDYVGSSYIGYDARVDIDDVERIEVIRGPGSVLYGTGAFFGVIHLVTRGRTAPTHVEAAASTADANITRGRATAQVRIGPEAGFWASVAAAHGVGNDYFFPEHANDAYGGNARSLDGFNAATTNGRVWYKDLTAQWFLTSRKKTLPDGGVGTAFGDPRDHFADTRGFLEVRYEPRVSAQLQSMSRAHINLYDFDSLLVNDYYAGNDGSLRGGVDTEAFRGIWGGLEQRFVYSPVRSVKITIGGELQRHFEAQQTGNDEARVLINRDDPYTTGAGYLIGDVTPEKHVKFSLGSRYDYNSTSEGAFDPRAAIIVKPADRWNVKVMAGRAFRAPSVYELFYSTDSQIPAPSLRPEHISSGEVEVSHRFNTTVTGTVAGYTNYVTDLVVLRGSGTPGDPNFYANSSSPILTIGGEAEVRREWRQGWMVAAQYSYQHSRYLNDGGTLRNVPNSPEHLAGFKGAVPIVGRSLVMMSRVSFDGPRWDRYDQVTDPPQLQTDPSVIWDLVFSGEAEKLGVRYSLGVYNITNWKAAVPISAEFVERTAQQNGRTVLATTSISF
ncbi:MAG: TonB-dependent receptor [Polyangiaceae bacterium]